MTLYWLYAPPGAGRSARVLGWLTWPPSLIDAALEPFQHPRGLCHHSPLCILAAKSAISLRQPVAARVETLSEWT
jgi:hypothetical protein